MLSYLKRLSLKRIYYRIIRQEGSPESIARGIGIGLFVAFLAPVGLQTVTVIPLAFLFRANKILAFIATFPTNPYTIPFIYPAQCYIGSLVMLSPMKFADVSDAFKTVYNDPTWANFVSLGNDIILPFIVGGAIFGIITGIIGYFATLGMVQRHRRRRELKLVARLSAMASAKEKSGMIEIRREDIDK